MESATRDQGSLCGVCPQIHDVAGLSARMGSEMNFKEGDQVIWFQSGKGGGCVSYNKYPAVVLKTPTRWAKRVLIGTYVRNQYKRVQAGMDNVEFPRPLTAPSTPCIQFKN